LPNDPTREVWTATGRSWSWLTFWYVSMPDYEKVHPRFPGKANGEPRSNVLEPNRHAVLPSARTADFNYFSWQIGQAPLVYLT
jgi:hypothetical protein